MTSNNTLFTIFRFTQAHVALKTGLKVKIRFVNVCEKKAVKNFQLRIRLRLIGLKAKPIQPKKPFFALNGLKPFRSIFFPSLVTFIINKTSTLKYPNSEFVVNYNIKLQRIRFPI